MFKMAFGNDRIKVKCNKCGGEMFSDEFVLDPDYKMVVCRNCIRDKRKRQEVWAEVGKQREARLNAENQEGEEAKKPKPAGWDKDDELLDRLVKQKQRVKETSGFKELANGKVKCAKCGYAFKYDAENHRPMNCPYCFNPVRKSYGF